MSEIDLNGPGSAPGAAPVLAHKTLPPMTAESSKELNRNPDRGFRYESWVDVREIALWGPSKERMNEVLRQRKPYGLGGGENDEYITIAFLYVYLDAFKETGLTPAAVDAVDAILNAYRQWGIKVRLNFCYQRGRGEAPVGVGASEEIILRDVEKLRPVISANKDVIYMLFIGFVGAYGEWHSENPAVDKSKIIRAVAETLCPPDTYMGARLPMYKNLLPADHPAYQRIGFTNDAFFGKTFRGYNRGSGGLDPGSEQWNQWMEQGPYTPNDGELFVSVWMRDNNTFPDPDEAVRALSEHRYTSLGYSHGYYDGPPYGIPLEETVMARWQGIPVTPGSLRELGVLYSPDWFRNKNGENVPRSVYEYIRDHLGYRLQAQWLKVAGEAVPGGKLEAAMSLVNHGFSAAFNLKSGFAILDGSGNAVETAEAGAPESWYPTSPVDYSDRSLLTHEISASLALPDRPGDYRLAFFLRNEMGQSARLANDIGYTGGYHILHSFSI